MNTNSTRITGQNLEEVSLRIIEEARRGDRRARPVSIGSRTGIATPHEDGAGHLDENDLAAQVWAIAHGTPSDSGAYTGGIFVCDGVGYFVSVPDEG